jgi:pathogenesis-related protein 1
MKPAGQIAGALGLALLAALGARAAGAPERAQVTSSQSEEMLRLHNEWRGKVRVPPLQWADDLAGRAQAQAQRLAAGGCRFDRGRLPQDVGENLFRAELVRFPASDDPMEPVNPTQVVNAWAAEAEHYSYPSNRCARGRQCAHYTQLVWADTREVGCGRAVCSSTGEIWVCDYRPAGNIPGRRPY